MYAVVQGESVWVGSGNANIRASVDMERADLTGIRDQDGYVLYSVVRDDKIKGQRSLDRPLQLNLKNSMDKKQTTSRGFIKYKNSSSSSGYSENHISF